MKTMFKKFVFLLAITSTTTTFSKATDVSSIQLSEPITADGILLSSPTELYVTSGWQGTTVTKIDLETGKVTMVASGLNGPVDVIQDQSGNILISNWQAQSISAVGKGGTLSEWLETEPKPQHMAFDSRQNLWFTTGNTKSIFKLTANGDLKRVDHNDIIQFPLGLAISEADKVMVGDAETGHIYEISDSGEPQLFASIPDPAPWQLGHMEFAGNILFATGLSSNQIYKINPDGSSQVFAGSGEAGHTDGPALSATFTYPVSLAVSEHGGHLYVFSGGEPTDKLRIITIGKTK